MQKKKSNNKPMLRGLSRLYCWFYFITGKSAMSPLFLMGCVIWSLLVILLMFFLPNWVSRHFVPIFIGSFGVLLGVIMPICAILLNHKNNEKLFLSQAGKDYFKRIDEKLIRTPAIVVHLIASLTLLLSCVAPVLLFYLKS